jgi:outer membrane protein assembly factor BamB
MMFDLNLRVYSLQHDLIIARAPLLLFSTLNGTLIAVDSNSGEEIWRLQEG